MEDKLYLAVAALAGFSSALVWWILSYLSKEKLNAVRAAITQTEALKQSTEALRVLCEQIYEYNKSNDAIHMVQLKAIKRLGTTQLKISKVLDGLYNNNNKGGEEHVKK